MAGRAAPFDVGLPCRLDGVDVVEVFGIGPMVLKDSGLEGVELAMPNNSKACTLESVVGSSDPGEGTGEGRRFIIFLHAMPSARAP